MNLNVGRELGGIQNGQPRNREIRLEAKAKNVVARTQFVPRRRYTQSVWGDQIRVFV